LSKRIGLSLLALLIVLGGNAFGAIVYPPIASTDPAAANWSFELGAGPDQWVAAATFVNAGGGAFSQAGDPTPGALAYARIFAGGGVAGLIASTALAGAIYEATAAIARNSADASWTLQLFQGGAPTVVPGTPAGATLLASTGSTSAPAAGNPGSPTWSNFGVQGTAVTTGAIWVRILANAGEVGADAVLGVTPAADGGGGGGAVPEPFTMGLVGSGFLGLALYRRRRA
jgi:hypothetical protein